MISVHIREEESAAEDKGGTSDLDNYIWRGARSEKGWQWEKRLGKWFIGFPGQDQLWLPCTGAGCETTGRLLAWAVVAPVTTTSLYTPCVSQKPVIGSWTHWTEKWVLGTYFLSKIHYSHPVAAYILSSSCSPRAKTLQFVQLLVSILLSNVLPVRIPSLSRALSDIAWTPWAFRKA